jgi:hypothetical protein
MRDPIPPPARPAPAPPLPAPVLRRLVREGLAALQAVCGPDDALVRLVGRMAAHGRPDAAWEAVRRALELVLPVGGAVRWEAVHLLGATADWTVARARIAQIRVYPVPLGPPPPCPRCRRPRAWRPGRVAACVGCGIKEALD